MARLKRSSAALDKATRRMAGMRSINDALEFGNGLSLTEYNTRIQTLQAQLSTYNTMLSGLDQMAGRIMQLEQELSSYSEKMLMSVATHYGKDSLQYVQAGGTQRKRATQRSSSTTTATLSTVVATETTNGKGTPASLN